MSKIMSAAQCRAARALLGWSQTELASRSGVSDPTVKRLESGHDVRESNREAIMAALETAGVEFVADGAASPDGGAGVRLRKRG